MNARRTRTLLALAAAGGVAAAVVVAPESRADTGIGCQTVVWGFLASQRRTLCDGPVRADGSWERLRMVWTPAHQVPITCYGSYFVTCNGGYVVDELLNSSERYPVTPATVLPDEPAHLVGVN